MNPIDVVFIAASAGCGAGMARFLNLLRVAQDAVHETGRRDEIVTDWKAMAAEVGGELEERQKVRSVRADTLRGIYLKQLENAAERPEEVPA